MKCLPAAQYCVVRFYENSTSYDAYDLGYCENDDSGDDDSYDASNSLNKNCNNETLMNAGRVFCSTPAPSSLVPFEAICCCKWNDCNKMSLKRFSELAKEQGTLF